jgi:hypothetical protein
MYEILCFELNQLVAVQYGEGDPTKSYVELCGRYIPPHSVFKSETVLKFGYGYCLYSHGSTMIQLIIDMPGDRMKTIHKAVNDLYSSCRQCSTVIPGDTMYCSTCSLAE